ncbi:hypothetical protein D9758_000837 [Tetrapyrgos nigripes]|uniref:RNA-dependent RNA polymerase n=1 Tax=Tetrapyrgos nigripes TaxID=182062 RepID=A0A8H5GZ37_9AGAR|nr:hypothetical protein D9758_000837 [Tetrapyrgos nigripes]
MKLLHRENRASSLSRGLQAYTPLLLLPPTFLLHLTMEICIRYLPHQVNEWDLTRALALVLHSEPFLQRTEDERFQKINFAVKVNPNKAGGLRNDGTGVLTLPTPSIGYRFLDYVKDTPFKMDTRKIKFFPSREKPGSSFALSLQKSAYIDPDIEEQRQEKIANLQDAIRVDIIQFGIYFRRPSRPGEPLKSREYSTEWQRDYAKESTAWLRFEYDHKLMRIELGNPMTEQIGSTIAITFGSIQRIAIGYDGGCPYVCFDTSTPPVFEETEFNRALVGDDHIDNQRYKHRIGSLHPGHEQVAPYAQKLRIILYNESRYDVIDKFKGYCKIAELSDSLVLDCRRYAKFHIEAGKREFFIPKRLYKLRLQFKQFDWSIAFQLEALLHNCLLHTEELEELLPRVKNLCKDHLPAFAAELLRKYGEQLQARSPQEDPIKCFERARSFVSSPLALSPGNFSCYHVTFAPTRLILEGPNPVQSNRIIRLYSGFEDHFIRVDFRDEDRLSYRWEREVDGSTFIERRVGETLKNGFELAGRYFEFLAYSFSALREHAVWFMNPFMHPEKGLVNAESIRRSIGNFEGTTLLKQPSKYAARLAQAFTATDRSVSIRRDEWEVVPDIENKTSVFTDGVGTIAQALANRVWEALCEGRHDQGRMVVQPSAYQIRFLGFKGVVSVDKELDRGPIKMRLRESMKKFESDIPEEADIEIALAFERPIVSYLNRPLVTVLEDRKVRKEAFLSLQREAVAQVFTVDDDISTCATVLRSLSYGRQYYLAWILEQLRKLGCDFQQRPGITSVDDTFFQELRAVARMATLRDMKHSARIPIPNSYLLVGVADEGPVYQNAGCKNVYILQEGHIYACVQKSPDDEPEWLEGSCTISRSPVAHPGDVQRVHAIGKPPQNMMCLFGHLKNVVVLPTVGKRSLASCLGGGDLDGDLYQVIMHPDLLPTKNADAAAYTSIGTHTLERECNVNDIVNFIVEYINSDVLGLLSDRLLVIADQSKEGTFDRKCTYLAELCSQAVDYPKQGIAVDLDKNKLPSFYMRPKPDWHAAEVVKPRKTGQILLLPIRSSTRAHVPRDIPCSARDRKGSEPFPENQAEKPKPPPPMQDPISIVLKKKLKQVLSSDYIDPNGRDPEIERIFRKYTDELRYVCATHTVSNTPGVRLLETEAVMGTILASCTQKRWRKDRIVRMKLHVGELVADVKREFQRDPTANIKEKDREEYLFILERAWYCWDYSRRQRTREDQLEFGANSFGLIALGSIFYCLDELSKIVV